jgi:hypothetical protein
MAKIFYENSIKKENHRGEYSSNLGITLAGLSDKTRAIQLGIKAVEMLPLKGDHLMRAEQMQINLVHIYIMTGELDEAIKKIDFLLSIPCQLTVWRLKLDPIYDPLRNKEKFRKIIEDNSG